MTLIRLHEPLSKEFFEATKKANPRARNTRKVAFCVGPSYLHKIDTMYTTTPDNTSVPISEKCPIKLSYRVSYQCLWIFISPTIFSIQLLVFRMAQSNSRRWNSKEVGINHNSMVKAILKPTVTGSKLELKVAMTKTDAESDATTETIPALAPNNSRREPRCIFSVSRFFCCSRVNWSGDSCAIVSKWIVYMWHLLV